MRNRERETGERRKGEGSERGEKRRERKEGGEREREVYVCMYVFEKQKRIVLV